MPPAISDVESMSDDMDGPESVPAKATKGKAKAEPIAKPESEDEQEEENDDSEEGEDEYSVDKIMDHAFEKGVLKYKVKWLGYEDEDDMTWEPLENLETAPDKLEEYHKKIGGPPEPPSKKRKSGAERTASEALDSPAPSATKKRGRKSATNGAEPEEDPPFQLPKGSWESNISHVMSIVEEDEPDSKRPGKSTKVLMGFLQWNDGGRKSKHPMKTLRTKCPQALLDYYENHLRFN